MTVQSDLQTALDAYIQANYSGSLAEVSAAKKPLEDLLRILDTVTTSGGGSITNYALETGGNLANIALATTDTTASGTITTQNLVPAGAATAGSAVSIDLDSKGTVTIQVTGTYTGALSAQITTDGTNWITPTNAVFKNMVTGANSVTIPSASVGIWQIEIIGHAKFRLSALATFTGTATIALRASANTSQVSVAGVSTAANQNTGNTSLAEINTKLPASLGAKTAANSLSVTQAFAATSTITNQASSATSVTLLAANNNRKTAIIINDSTSDLYVTLNASAASTTNYSLFLAAKVGNMPSFLAINGDDYSGEIRGIWSSANGFARITEIV